MKTAPNMHIKEMRMTSVAVLLSLLLASHAAAAAVLFTTQFEPAEGYNPQFTLAEQPATASIPWKGLGTGGNGLLTEPNAFPGFGQQAYVGFFPPTTQERDTFVWRPINLATIPTETPIIQFTVLLEIVDSTNRHFDEFQWIVSNTAERPLLTISLENNSREIFFIRDGIDTFQSTGVKFENNVRYAFELTMNFAENTWSAKLDGALLASAQPIALPATLRDLGDVAAAWVVKEIATPGDNFMVFDSYEITALPVGPEIPPVLTALGFVNGQFTLRLQGVNSKTYAIERSTGLQEWDEIWRDVAAGGAFEFRDPDPSGAQRAYRARRVP